MEMGMDVFEELCAVAGQENVLLSEPMSAHTTFRVGGPADYFVTPDGEEMVRDLIVLLKEREIPYYVIGNGSNILVGDKGFRGVVIQIFKKMNRIRTEGETIYAQAGALLSRIAAQALANELTGFEFASGIPGTLGGAVIMNAGAYGGEMKQVLSNVCVLTRVGELRVVPAGQMKMGYRTSSFAENQDIVLSAELRLERGSADSIRSYMEELRERRILKQPLEYPSAGSTFKRPEGYFAGKLIQDAGLCGFRVGGAQVSKKHCGFVINRDHATAADIVELMRQVADKVEENAGVRLEPEVKQIGEF
jgi:UDP-N-acetylmuramate dehydrogenase